MEEFVTLYRGRDELPDTQHPRWRQFSHESILAAEGARMDLTWEPGEKPGQPASVARLDELAAQIAADLERALSHVSRGARGNQ
jgi:hypothetical protein